MCARRFLLAIVILTFLGVAAAFAIFQFGDRALTRMAKPQGHFAAPATATGPDYGRSDAWVARPGIEPDPSRWLPSNGLTAAVSDKGAATFFVHPTTYLERDRWNATLDPDGETESRTALFVRSQASAFNGVSEIWAPRYRQAAFGAFLLSDRDSRAALDLAYRDVLAAFDHFLAQQPAGKPLILAGHSQGALHLARLLVDRRAMLRGRLVAAYVVGWPLSATADLPAIGLPACAAQEQTGCLLSWQSFGEPANPRLITDAWVGTPGYAGGNRARADMVCVNPLTGTAGGAAPPSANLGTLEPDAKFIRAEMAPGLVGARCEKGLLIVDGAVPPLGPFVLPGNNYHVYDYALFWGSIRADAARRLAAFRAPQ